MARRGSQLGWRHRNGKGAVVHTAAGTAVAAVVVYGVASMGRDGPTPVKLALAGAGCGGDHPETVALRRLLKEVAAGGEVKGDVTTLEDFSVLAKLKEKEEA